MKKQQEVFNLLEVPPVLSREGISCILLILSTVHINGSLEFVGSTEHSMPRVPPCCIVPRKISTLTKFSKTSHSLSAPLYVDNYVM